MTARTIHPRMVRARSALIIQQPFFGCLAMGLECIEVPNDSPFWPKNNATMATDGARLFYAPAFIEAHNDSELCGVVAHEILHCAYMHHTRRQGRDGSLWNIAADFAINRDLKKAGFTLPKSALFDPRFDGMHAEEIYSTLQNQQQKQNGKPQPGGQGEKGQSPGGQSSKQPGKQPGEQSGQDKPDGQGSGESGGESSGQSGGQSQGGANPDGTPAGVVAHDPGGCGAVVDAAPEWDAAGNAAAESDWQVRVRSAIAVARAQAGKIPGELEGLVKALNEPKQNWRHIVRDFVDSTVSKEETWNRRNRRYIACGRYLPGKEPDRPNKLIIVMDTSGSIWGDPRELQSFGDECQAILDDAADSIVVIYADTEARGEQEFCRGDMLSLDVKGGGGTCFNHAMKYAAENHADAAALIYMTDGLTNSWGAEPPFPVLWLITGPRSEAERIAMEAPYGQVIVLN